ncbi:hypothetical protein GCM10023191_000160 [Actinoallomurus oryzae]|uniref:Uncharacterized protein n=1 Tax=Actinoallomurus oryzae TaxID=502180 RepID=A0ABP8P3D5_9ACTN
MKFRMERIPPVEATVARSDDANMNPCGRGHVPAARAVGFADLDQGLVIVTAGSTA